MKLCKVLVVAFLAALVCLVGCGGSSTPQGSVVFYNAVPEISQQTIDVFRNSSVVVSGIPYANRSSVMEVDAGSANFTVSRTGGAVPFILNAPVNIVESVDQLVLVTGISNGVGARGLSISNLGQLDLSTTTLPQNTQARVYFVNADVDPTVNTVSFGFIPQGGQPQFPAALANISFRQLTNPIILQSGAYNFVAQVNTTKVPSTAINILGTKIYLVVLAGPVPGQNPGVSLNISQLN